MLGSSNFYNWNNCLSYKKSHSVHQTPLTQDNTTLFQGAKTVQSKPSKWHKQRVFCFFLQHFSVNSINLMHASENVMLNSVEKVCRKLLEESMCILFLFHCNCLAITVSESSTALQSNQPRTAPIAIETKALSKEAKSPQQLLFLLLFSLLWQLTCRSHAWWRRFQTKGGTTHWLKMNRLINMIWQLCHVISKSNSKKSFVSQWSLSSHGWLLQKVVMQSASQGFQQAVSECQSNDVLLNGQTPIREVKKIVHIIQIKFVNKKRHNRLWFDSVNAHLSSSKKLVLNERRRTFIKKTTLPIQGSQFQRQWKPQKKNVLTGLECSFMVSFSLSAWINCCQLTLVLLSKICPHFVTRAIVSIWLPKNSKPAVIFSTFSLWRFHDHIFAGHITRRLLSAFCLYWTQKNLWQVPFEHWLLAVAPLEELKNQLTITWNSEIGAIMAAR